MPTYIEFIVIKARATLFPPQFTNQCYDVIQEWGHLHELRTSQFANVKLVSDIILSINGLPVQFNGYAEPSAHSMVIKNSTADALLLLHEYGHIAGIEHRGWVIVNVVRNPGDPNDTSAVMYCPNAPGDLLPGTGIEMNRFERAKMYSFSPEMWNTAP